MREIHVDIIKKEITRLCLESNFALPKDVLDALERAFLEEINVRAKEILGMIIENAKYAEDKKIPICQDTGYAVCFFEIGQQVHIVGGELEDAIQKGIEVGYKDLRKSIVSDPFKRNNTNDNVPGIIHYRIVPGDNVKIFFMPKGGGSENVSKFKIFKPTVQKEKIKEFILDAVIEAGGNPCPPVIVGVGIGGTSEKAFELAKHSLLRKIGVNNSDSDLELFEKDLKERINKTGVGPSGLGGKTTCLAVHVETYPCHIASLPVAVNIQCHAARHMEVVI
ncbi:fumarate hydratase [Chlamydiota bacterium]